MDDPLRTKIVVTLGPASSDEQTIARLLAAGLNVARLNFSHGNYQSHETVIETVRKQASLLGKKVAVLQDLSGPKLRIGAIAGDRLELASGQRVRFCYGQTKFPPSASQALSEADSSDSKNRENRCHFPGHALAIEEYTGRAEAINKWAGVTLSVDAFEPSKVIKINHRILLADGRLELICRELGGDWIEAEVMCGGNLRSHAGINLPDSDIQLDAVTKKDIEDLQWGIAHGVDYVALSYVSGPEDIIRVKQLIEKSAGKCRVIAKIERRMAVEHSAEILEVADGIMIARGDLGLEIPLESVPRAQRKLIAQARAAGKPVITATQLLLSLVTEVRPTRAEVSDIYTAVMEGTDAVMLSEETAIGRHPVRVIEILQNILRKAEEDIDWPTPAPWELGRAINIGDALAFAAQQAGDKLGARAILVYTESGYTAKLLSHYRPSSSVFVLTNSVDIEQELALYWGLNMLPVEARFLATLPGQIDPEQVIQALGIGADEPVVVLRGKQMGQAVATIEVYGQCSD